MPNNIKCRYVTKNGNPINGGCRDSSRCRFLHPEDDSFWKDVPVRCKFFDDNGRPIRGGCKYVISSECAWAHPEEPEWMGRRRPKPTILSSYSTLPAPSPPPTNSNVTRQSQDRASISVPVELSPQTVQMKRIENSGDEEKNPIRSVREEEQAPSETLQKQEIASDSATPSQRSPIDTIMPSYPKAGLGGPSCQLWKDRITAIAKATGKYQELMDTRSDLENDNLFLGLLPPDMVPELRKLVENRHSNVSINQREVEETMNNANSELDAFWSIPIVSKPSEKYRSEVDSLFKSLGLLLGQIEEIEQSIKQKEEWQREQAGKAKAVQESLSHSPSYETLIQRAVEFENRLRLISSRIDDEEDVFESEKCYWNEQSANVKTSYSVIKDQGRLLDNLSSDLVALRKESVSFTDLNPPLRVQQDDSLDINTRFTSLIDEHQANAEKKMKQILLDIDQCCLELTKPDPTTKALQAFQTDILSAVERCIDEHKDQLEEVIQKCHDDNKQAFGVQMDPIVNMLDTFFMDLTSFDVL